MKWLLSFPPPPEFQVFRKNILHFVKRAKMCWILASNQRQIIEQAKFAYSPLGKGFEKQTKAVEE